MFFLGLFTFKCYLIWLISFDTMSFFIRKTDIIIDASAMDKSGLYTTIKPVIFKSPK